MKQQEAEDLLNKTFNQEFKIEKFSQFVKELFNEIDIAVEDKTPFIGRQYQDHITDLKKLGEFWDSDRKKIEILAVKLGKPTSLDRARTMQRNFIANWLGKIDAEGALVGFYDEDHLDWRFSFVKMEYNLVRDEEGKVKVAKKLTPAKRYSYLVGINEPNHTCKSQFLNLVKNEVSNPTLSDIEQAFSIETVTKEFFEKYKELVIDLKESIEKVLDQDEKIKIEFENKMIKPIDFAKKLLGQIVFLYFLQKKGWLGVKKGNEWGTGPHNFLRRLFGDKNRDIEPIVTYDNFFNEILEPLFYDALSNPRPGDDGYYIHFRCKIPFLNGGLFEPLNDYDWAGTDILIDNDVFEKIFEVFNRFNFTVKEDEPLDKEVAVDPEMLGKVFENLLEVKERKDKGAFYTPREIVHYMCQQSLINYLETNINIKRDDIETFIQYGDLALEHVIKDLEQQKTYNGQSYVDEEFLIPESISYNFRKIDRLLKNIKIVDPAVGSGAFPVGMMNEIVKSRSILTIYFSEEEQKKRTNYNFKRETIANSLYGVDIDQSGVEIAKLRFWLSLIVDETDMTKIKPLPNLDHKVMCGNSLLAEFEGIKLFDDKLLGSVKKDKQDELKEIDELILDLKDNLSKVKSIEIGKKRSIAKDIKKLKRKREKVAKQAATESTEQISLGITESEKKIKKLRSLQKRYFNVQNRKLKRELRSKIDKLEWDLIEVTLKEQNHEEALEKLEQYRRTKVKPFFLWKLYFAEVFQRENPGFDVVIANPPYLREKGNKEIFEIINNSKFGNKYHQGKMDYWFYFLHKAINLVRDKGIISYITSRYWLNSQGSKKLITRIEKELVFRSFIDIGKLKVFDNVVGQHMVAIYKKSDKPDLFIYKKLVNNLDGIYSSSNSDNAIVKKMSNNDLIIDGEIILEPDFINRENTISLGDVCETSIGIQESVDRISKKQINNSNRRDVKEGDGVFVLTKNEIEKLGLNETEKKILKKYLDPNDVLKYCIDKRNLKFIIYSDKEMKEKIAYDSDFINIKSHLDNLSEFITSSNRPYGLHRPRDIKFFIRPKIIFKGMFKNNEFHYDEDKFFVGFSFSTIIEKDKNYSLKYILAILNSHLALYWFYKNGKKRGGGVDIGTKKLRKFPIKILSREKQGTYSRLVDQILSITKDDDYLDNLDKQERVKKLEGKIDSLVYDLYDLIPDEIKIVEDFINGKNKD